MKYFSLRVAFFFAILSSAEAQVLLPELSGYAFTPLSLPAEFTGDNTQAIGINNSLQIVGVNYTDGAATGFLYSAGTYTKLEVPGHTYSAGFGINNNGDIVGTSGNGNLGIESQGFILKGGVYTSFSSPGAGHFVPQGITDNGIIVGQVDNQIFKYSDGTYTYPALPGNPSAYGLGVNNAETFVGFSGPNGFINEGGVFSLFNIPGANSTAVGDINNSNTLVGQYGEAGINHGFLRKDGTTYRLDYPGAYQSWINAINDNGAVTGFYQMTDTSPLVAYYATPVPEPAAGGAAMAGLLAAIWLVARNHRAAH
jgi:uncharacterized membrane protein